jgi:hypothetical protein
MGTGYIGTLNLAEAVSRSEPAMASIILRNKDVSFQTALTRVGYNDVGECIGSILDGINILV